ncbi:DUF1289 domain-containing protein [Haliea sp. E17]|uniref:DUF1289 domain-containing protein n=1 Tax=Haliea sp. E17 TaxID=3401576 RepID=UPI003AAFF2B1
MTKWHKTEEQKLVSACVHICNLIEGSKVCGGCFRTTDEIAAWRKLDVEARRAILQQAELRQQDYPQ